MIKDPNMAWVAAAFRELSDTVDSLKERVRQLEEEVAALRRQTPDIR